MLKGPKVAPGLDPILAGITDKRTGRRAVCGSYDVAGETRYYYAVEDLDGRPGFLCEYPTWKIARRHFDAEKHNVASGTVNLHRLDPETGEPRND